MIGGLALTFACGAAYECGCVFWVAHSEAGRSGKAVLWSMFNALVTAIGVEQFLKGPAFLVAYVLGYGFGTYVAIEYKARGSRPGVKAPDMLTVSTETLQAFVGGQIEVQNSVEGYLYRGEIQSAAVDGEMLALHLAWTARGEGFPPMPSHWVKSARNAFTASLKLYRGSNIGPGTTGSDRWCFMSPDGKETVILYPPDGSRLPEPP